MQYRTLSVVATIVVLSVLAVAVHAMPLRQSDPADQAQAPQPAQTEFLAQFTSSYLLAVAQRREVQDYDLRDGRAWARAILSGADERE